MVRPPCKINSPLPPLGAYSCAFGRWGAVQFDGYGALGVDHLPVAQLFMFYIQCTFGTYWKLTVQYRNCLATNSAILEAH